MSHTYLVKNGRSVGAILRDTRSDNLLLKRAEELIQTAVRNAGGRPLVVVNYRELPESGKNYALAIGTAGYMKQIFGLGDALAGLGDEGFCIFPTSAANALVTVVTGRTERAVYHGVVHLTDFLLKEKGQDLFIPAVRVRRAPAMKVRGTYNLACWGRSPEYTADDWKRILDAMAEDSMNCIYFWLAGLFASRRVPETFYYKNTRLTNSGIQELIAYAHALGIEFYLGSGMFAWFGVDELAKTHPEAAAKGTKGLCPSHLTARRLMLDYLTEMYDAFPEADGLFLEIRDEYGECQCERCRTPMNGIGSRQYGESEMTFLQEVAQTIGQRHPRAKFVACIGYKEHERDVRFYQAIKTMHAPRFSWLVVRGNWAFPGEDGRPRPLTHFSPNMIHWKQYYRASLKELCEWVGRADQEHLMGCCPAFEPGFSSASFYSEEIPFPVDRIPYAVTRLAFRELCWTPQIGEEKLRELIRDKFFGSDSPAELTEAVLYLFNLIREASTNPALNPKGPWMRGSWRRFLDEVEKSQSVAVVHGTHRPAAESTRLERDGPQAVRARLEAYLKIAGDALPQLDALAALLDRDESQWPPKARRALPMLRRALSDARSELCLTAADVERVRAVAQRLK